MVTLDDYERHLGAKHLAVSTIRQHLVSVRRLMQWRRCDDWREIVLDDLLQWNAAMLSEGMGAANRCKQLWQVKAFFAWLHRQGAILTNPAAKLPPQRKPKPLPRHVPTAEQVNVLLAAPSTATPQGTRDRAMLELLYSSGLRAGELCKLTIYDLDRDKRTLRVTQAKGRKDRVVPVGVFALDCVAAYLDKARATLNNQAKPGRAGARLFLTDQGAAFTTAKLARLVRSYAKQAALPSAFTTHSLRHACATGMLRGGASIRHVQEMLGHSSIKTTQIYTHIVKDDLKAIHAKTSPSERRTNVEAPAFTFARWRPRKQKKPRKSPRKPTSL
jgi:site-specific recombinase XerD